MVSKEVECVYLVANYPDDETPASCMIIRRDEAHNVFGRGKRYELSASSLDRLQEALWYKVVYCGWKMRPLLTGDLGYSVSPVERKVVFGNV